MLLFTPLFSFGGDKVLLFTTLYCSCMENLVEARSCCYLQHFTVSEGRICCYLQYFDDFVD